MFDRRAGTDAGQSLFCLLLCAASFLWLGCRDGHDADSRPNVLLYVIDTLRADVLEPYGNEVVATPTIEGLAESGVLYERAYSHSSWTRPSISSILTGLTPDLHGVENRADRMPVDQTLLAERFRAAGYATGAIITNPNVGVFFGFDQGYDEFQELYAKKDGGIIGRVLDRADSDVVTDKAIAWIDRAKRPFFLFVLTTDPHGPYDPPKAFDRYGPTPEEVQRRLSSKNPLAGLALARERGFGLYQGEVAFNDFSLGRLFDHLRSAGLWDESLIVVTADHGEEFFDHQGIGHGKTLFEEMVHIPLIIRRPHEPHPGLRVPGVVAEIDLVPTILTLAGLPVPDGLPGRLLPPEGRAEPRSIFASLQLDGREGQMLLEDPWKVIHRTAGPWQERVPTHPIKQGLFNLETDPLEHEDLTQRYPARSEAMRERLAGIEREAQRRRAERERAPSSSGQKMPSDVRDALEVLGYIKPGDSADPEETPAPVDQAK